MKAYIDVETTGLVPGRDEILEIAILDGRGKVLFHRLAKPIRVEEWPRAEEVNGISPAMVEGENPISSYAAEIESILERAMEVYGYNIGFDLGMLAAAGIARSLLADFRAGAGKPIDVMEWASVELCGGRRWLSLSDVASRLGIRPRRPHTSVGDCLTCRAVSIALDRLSQGD